MPRSAAPARLTQEQRSEAMRQRLIDATIACIGERGFANATTAEISERAGVSSGARVHHFKTKLDLVIAATVFAYEQATVESLRAAAAPASLRNPLLAFIEDAYRFYSGPRYLMQHEVVHAARTSEPLMQALAPAANAYRAAVSAAWLEAFRQAGHSQDWSTTAMDLSIVIVRGLALGSFLRGRDQDTHILQLWHAVMAQHPDPKARARRR